MNAFRLRSLVMAVVPATVVGIAGCGTSPTTTSFDPVALNNATTSVLNAITGGMAIQSMTVLGSHMTLSAAAAPSAGATMGVFPPGAPLGSTYAYDAALQQYVLSDATGAPANGVRFMLYSVPVTAQSSTIGYVDLLDDTTALGVRVFETGSQTPVVEYRVSGDTTSLTAAIAGSGLVNQGTTAVDLDTLAESFSATSGVTLDHRLSAPSQGLSIAFHVAVSGSVISASLTGTATIRDEDGNTTVISGSGSASAFSGTVTYNGTVVVKFSGLATSPVFTDPSGGQLDPSWTTALKSLAQFTSDLPCAIDALLKPAHRLFTPNTPWLTC